jgi:hypothetical protein
MSKNLRRTCAQHVASRTSPLSYRRLNLHKHRPAAFL